MDMMKFTAENSIRPAVGIYRGRSMFAAGTSTSGVAAQSGLCNGNVYAYSASCGVRCYFYAGVCNWAKTTRDCPKKYDENGKYLGQACCTQQEYDSVYEQACRSSWNAINSSPYCKTNCREEWW